MSLNVYIFDILGLDRYAELSHKRIKTLDTRMLCSFLIDIILNSFTADNHQVITILMVKTVGHGVKNMKIKKLLRNSECFAH